jgi:CheY-like chemotaxis protein
MSLHHKLKLSFNPQEYCDTSRNGFSLYPSCLSEHNLLYYSVTSNFKEIGYPYEPSHAKINAAPEAGKSIPTTNEKILIVDDEEDITRLFKLALERAGYIVDMYNDPLKSLSNYRAGKYDLLLLDIKMPHLNGFELYNKIRQIDDKTKVCFMTAFEEYYAEFKRIFPDLKEKECFIRKPIGMNDLIKTVQSHLSYN